jgi:hypothetical protein
MALISSQCPHLQPPKPRRYWRTARYLICMLALFLQHSSSSILRASVFIIAAIPLPLFARNDSFDSITALNVQIANHSGVPHGDIPDEDVILKDGQTYQPFSGPLKHVQEDIQYHKHKKWGFQIYRYDYASDEAWAKFLSNLN